MFKRNQINTAVLVAALTIGTSVAIAETANVSATVSVQNAFNLAQTTPLSFGVLRVTQTASSSTPAHTAPSVTINADGSAPTIGAASGYTASISVITPGSAAVFAIDGAAPNTVLTVTLPPSVALEASGGTTSQFVLDFTATDDIQVVGGTNDGDAYTGFNLVTDVDGEIGFNLGGTLSTRKTDTTYIDTSYSGNYAVTVAY